MSLISDVANCRCHFKQLASGLWQCQICHIITVRNEDTHCIQAPVFKITKKCPKCLEIKPLSPEFWHKHARNHDGFQARCKSCHNAYRQFSKSKLPAQVDKLIRHGYTRVVIDVLTNTVQPA